MGPEQLQQQVAAAVAAAKDAADGKREAAGPPPQLLQVLVGLAALAVVKVGADNLGSAVSHGGLSLCLSLLMVLCCCFGRV